MFLKKWVELDVTFDPVRFSRIITILNREQIAFKEKVQSMGHNTRRMGDLGMIGERQRYSTLYQIFVTKDDFEKAKYTIHQVVRD